MKSILFVILFTVGIGVLQSQECQVILLGEIVDFHDNRPLEDAKILVTGTTITTVSDEKGKFTLKNLCNGVIELEVSHPECKSQFVTVELDGDAFKKISLEHHLEELEEVHVVGDAISNKTNSSQEEGLSSQDVERFSGNSLGDALKQINGVSSLNTGANIVKPVIQGLNGSRVLILNNKVRMQDMEWGEEHAPNVDINSNQKISVIKGAAALQYGGDAIGGVILMEPLSIIRTDSLFGKTQINLFSNGRGGNITTSLTKSYDNGFFVTAQGSFKKLGDLETPDYLLSNTGIQEKGLSFSIGKRDFIQGWEGYYSFFDSDIGILRASHIGNIDDLIQAINSEQPNFINNFTYNIERPNQEVTHHLAKLNYYRRFEGFGKWNLQYDFQRNQRFEFDIRVGDDAAKASLDLRLLTHSLSSDLKLDSKKGLEVNLGVMGRYQNNFADPATGVRRLIPDYDKYELGLFAIGEYEISENWLLDGGVRYDFTRMDAKKFYRTSRWQERGYDTAFADLVLEDLGTQLLTNPIFNYHNVSATLGLKHELAMHNVLRANYSYSNRAPNPSELFSDGLHHSAARIELGDLRIMSESASKFSASLERTTDKWGYTFSPYINLINDFILLEPTDVEFTIRGAFPVWSYRQTDVSLIGLDASIYTSWTSNIRTDHKFSWVRGTDVTSDIALINIPAAKWSNSIGYQNEELNNLSIVLESQYVFEQNRFPPNISVFSPEQQQEVVLDINTPPDPYHLLSIDSQVRFTIRKENNLTVGLRMTNLLDTVYRDYLNRQRYFADDLGRNISLRLIYNY